jgi:hypothetical protein
MIICVLTKEPTEVTHPKCQARLEMLAPNAPAYLLAPAEESKKKVL